MASSGSRQNSFFLTSPTTTTTRTNQTNFGITDVTENLLWSTVLPASGSTAGFPDYGNGTGGTANGDENTSILNSTTKAFVPSEWYDYALVALFCSIIAGTVIGNTLVIAAVATTRRLRTVTNCFVMSLAVADWLVGMFVMPIKVVYHLSNNYWQFGSIVCQIWLGLDVLLCTSSILSLCTISIDRYLAITRPLAYSRKRRSKRLALSMISCVWVASFLITSPPILGWPEQDTERMDRGECKYNDDLSYVVYSAVGSFFLPLLIMLYVYARIACVIAQRQNSILKTHKVKETKCYGSEETIPGNEMALQKKKKNEKNGETNSKSANFQFLTKSAGQNKPKQKTSTSFWTRFRRLKPSFKSKSEQAHQRSGEEELDAVTHRNEIPSPSTILSMGNGKNINSKSTGNGYGRQIGGINNGASRITRTGSRLCNHSLTNCSPPRSIAHRVQPSSSSRVSVFSEGDIAMRTRSGSRNEMPGRVWTVEDEEADLEKQEQLLAKATLSINTAANGRSPCSCHPGSENDLSKTSPSHFGQRASLGGEGGRFNYAAQRKQPLQANLLKSTNNHAMRSRSVKVHLTFNSSDPAHGSAGRDFSTGRVASFKRETKTAQTLAAVVGGFIICWLPFFVAYVLGPFVAEDSIPNYVMEAFIWLGWSNSAINPFIYAFYSADFRSAFWRLTIQKCNGLFKSSRSPDRSSPKRYQYYYRNPPGRRRSQRHQRFSHPNTALGGQKRISAQPNPALAQANAEEHERILGSRANSV